MAQPMIHDDADDCQLAYLCSWSRFTRRADASATFSAALDLWSEGFEMTIADQEPDTVEPDQWHGVRRYALAGLGL